MKTKIRKNIKILPYFYFFVNFNPTSVILWIYLTDQLGSAALAMSCMSFTFIFSSILEVPTGVFSDVVGRRITMIMGAISRFCIALVLVIAHYIGSPYYMYVLSAFFTGLSLALFSGTDKALTYETLYELKKKHKFPHVLGKFSSLQRFSWSLSALLGGILAGISYLYVFYLNLIVITVPIFISLFFVEPKSIEDLETKKKKDFSLKHFTEALSYMVKNKKLRYLAIGYSIEGALNSVSNAFRQVFLRTIVPIWLIGIAHSMKNFFEAVGFWLSGKIIDKFGYYKSFIGAGIISKIIMLLGIGISSIVTPFVFAVTAFLRAPYRISFASLTQKEFTSKQRATMDSIIAMLKGFLAALLTFLTGVLSDATNPKFALVMVVVLSYTGFAFYKKVFKTES